MINKITNYFTNLDFKNVDSWTVIVGLSYLYSQLLIYYVPRLTFTLHSFKHRTIGVVVLDGVDASLRTFTYILLIGTSFLILFLIILLTGEIRKFLRAQGNQFVISRKQDVLTLSLLGIVFMITQLATSSSFSLLTHLIIDFIIVIELFSIFTSCKLSSKYNVIEIFKALFLASFYLIACLILFLIISRKQIYYSKESIPPTLFVCFVMILTAVLFAVHNIKKECIDRILGKLYFSTIPIALIPIFLIIGSEIQFKFPIAFPSTRKLLFSIIILLMLASALIFYFLNPEKWKFVNTKKLFQNFYFPSIIVNCSIFSSYITKLVINEFDLFHKGEDLLPIQQLSQFNLIPYIDIFPTHGMASIFHQWLYVIVQNYGMYEPEIYAWVTNVMYALTVYIFFNFFVLPRTSLFITLLLPIHNLIPAYYFFLLIPIFLIIEIVNQKTVNFKNWLYQVLLVLGAFLWRLDFGIALFIVVLSLSIIYLIKTLITKRKIRKKQFLYCLLAFASVGIISFAIVLFLTKGDYVRSIAIFKKLVYFVQIQPQSQAYSVLFTAYTPQVFYEYVLLPIAVIIYFLTFLVNLKNDGFENRHKLLLFSIALVTAIMSIRSLQRHSLVESFNPIFLVLLISFLPIYLSKSPLDKTKNVYWFLIIFIFSTLLIFAPSRSNLLTDSIDKYSSSENNYNKYLIYNWKPNEKRVVANEDQFSDLVKYLNSVLGDDQTFLDLTNSPLLYVASQRKFLTYLIPVIYQTSDYIQENEVLNLEKKYQLGKIPIVIAKNNSWWDKVDSVDNEVRNYKLFEFLYTHYQPYGKISNYELWLANNSTLKIPKYKREELNLGSVTVNSATKEINGDRLIIKSEAEDAQIIFSPNQTNKNEYQFLSFRVKANNPIKLQIFFSYDLDKFSEQQSYFENFYNNTFTEKTIPLQDNTGKKYCQIRIDPPPFSELELADVVVNYSNYPLITRIETRPQLFELKNLPYIWGTYDDKDSVRNSDKQQSLLNSPSTINMNQITTFDIDTNIEKSSGNYLQLKLKNITKDGLCRINYGAKPKALSGFTFFIKKDQEVTNYMVRISSQWDWMNNLVDYLNLTCDVPFDLIELNIRKGD